MSLSAPVKLRRAEWREFDLNKAVWTIPADKMKMRNAHEVPLSRQTLELLESAHAISEGQQYIFSSLYPGKRPMSENTINAALRRMGYTGKEMTAHGFRSMASTLLNESGKWSPDAIERALAHKDTNTVRAAYHRGKHWEERVQMAHGGAIIWTCCAMVERLFSSPAQTIIESTRFCVASLISYSGEI